MSLTNRCICRLGLEGGAPDHSASSKTLAEQGDRIAHDLVAHRWLSAVGDPRAPEAARRSTGQR